MRLSARELAEKYKDSVFRAAFSVSRNPDDAENVAQETSLSYMESTRQFENEEHIKAWLLRTAINKSKNVMRSFWHRNRTSLEDYMAGLTFHEPQDQELVEAVLSLPKSCRIVMYLYYYEEYSVKEVAGLLGLSEEAVKSRLFRGRKMLKELFSLIPYFDIILLLNSQT